MMAFERRFVFEGLLTNGALKWSRVAVNYLVRFEIAICFE